MNWRRSKEEEEEQQQQSATWLEIIFRNFTHTQLEVLISAGELNGNCSLFFINSFTCLRLGKFSSFIFYGVEKVWRSFDAFRVEIV